MTVDDLGGESQTIDAVVRRVIVEVGDRLLVARDVDRISVKRRARSLEVPAFADVGCCLIP